MQIALSDDFGVKLVDLKSLRYYGASTSGWQASMPCNADADCHASCLTWLVENDFDARDARCDLDVLQCVGVNAGLVQWPEGVRFLPDQAAMSMLGTPAFEVTELPPVIGALALGLWALVAICGYAVALIRRDG